MFNKTVREQLKNFLIETIHNPDWQDCYIWCEDKDDDCGDCDYQVFSNECGADWYECGVSKICLFYENLKDWVIKVPILGYYYNEEDEYVDFTHSGGDKPNDYCSIEAEYCFQADKYGLGECFAKTYYICTLQGIDFYCSEKIEEPFYSRSSNACSDFSYISARDLINCYGKYNSPLNLDQLQFFIDSYGYELSEKLMQFLIDFDIQDLHNGNIGFDTVNNVKIIDCAGWRD